jgi:hypothetical protein
LQSSTSLQINDDDRLHKRKTAVILNYYYTILQNTKRCDRKIEQEDLGCYRICLPNAKNISPTRSSIGMSGYFGFTFVALSTFLIPTNTCMHTKFETQINYKEKKARLNQKN